MLRRASSVAFLFFLTLTSGGCREPNTPPVLQPSVSARPVVTPTPGEIPCPPCKHYVEPSRRIVGMLDAPGGSATNVDLPLQTLSLVLRKADGTEVANLPYTGTFGSGRDIGMSIEDTSYVHAYLVWTDKDGDPGSGCVPAVSPATPCPSP